MKPFPEELRALLVDFDGTLINSLPALWSCYHLFMQKHQQVATIEEFRRLTGPALFEIVTYLKAKYALPQDFAELYADYRKLIANAYAQEAVLFPHALEVLQRLKDKGIKLAIVTSASLDLMQPFIQKHVAGIFDAIIAHVEGEESKPSPAIYKRALKHLEMTPDVSVAIEDSKNGILSADAANLYVVQFLGSFDEKAKGSVISNVASSRVHTWLEFEELCKGVK